MTSTTHLGVPAPNAPPIRLLLLREVMEMTRRSRSSIYADIAAGKFPRPIKTGARSIAFCEHHVLSWLEHKIRANEVMR